jgi:hypothetical protein
MMIKNAQYEKKKKQHTHTHTKLRDMDSIFDTSEIANRSVWSNIPQFM